MLCYGVLCCADDDLIMDTCQINSFFSVMEEVGQGSGRGP